MQFKLMIMNSTCEILVITVITLNNGTDRPEQTVDPDQMLQNAGIWSGSRLLAT